MLQQRWEDLASFHWRYPVDEVRRLLPDRLDVDTFDGDAWVGLIPFHMRAVRLGVGPVFPYVGTFVEINVRTYVVDPAGNRGVWFWSLDVPRAPAVAVARAAFALPYCWGTAQHDVLRDGDGEHHRYRCTRRWPRASAATTSQPWADIDYTVGERVAAADVTGLDHFVTARWSLYSARGARLRRGDVHHARWPIHRVTDHRIDQSLIEAAGLPSPVGDPHALASPGVSVRVGWLQEVSG